jgi:hypothetical protein
VASATSASTSPVRNHGDGASWWSEQRQCSIVVVRIPVPGSSVPAPGNRNVTWRPGSTTRPTIQALPPKETWPKQARQTRAVIPAAARERFLERGYTASTIDEIAVAAGVSKLTMLTAAGNWASSAARAATVRDVPSALRGLRGARWPQPTSPAAPSAPRGAVAGFSGADDGGWVRR